MLAGRELAHKQRLVIGNIRPCLEIGMYIGAEGADVGQPPAVEHLFSGMARVPAFHFLLLGPEIVAQQTEARKIDETAIIKKMDAVLVDHQRAHDPSAARFRHPAPVAETFINKPVRGDGSDGLVEILHLHRVQCDVDDVAIGVELRHLDPVAQADHVIGADLNRGDQREDRVLEHEHEHGRHGPQPGKQQQGRAVHQSRYDENGRSAVDDHLADLDIALDGTIGGVRAALVDVVRQFQPAAQGNGDRQNDEPRAQALDKGDDASRNMRYRDDACLDHERRHDIGQARHDGADMMRPDLEREAFQHAQDDAEHDPLGDPIGQPGEDQQHQQSKAGLHPGLLRPSARQIVNGIGCIEKSRHQYQVLWAKGSSWSEQPAVSGMKRRAARPTRQAAIM